MERIEKLLKRLWEKKKRFDSNSIDNVAQVLNEEKIFDVVKKHSNIEEKFYQFKLKAKEKERLSLHDYDLEEIVEDNVKVRIGRAEIIYFCSYSYGYFHFQIKSIKFN